MTSPDDLDSAAERPVGRARWRRLTLVLVVVAAAYAALWTWAPSFRAQTLSILEDLGALEPLPARQARAPIVVDGRLHLWGGPSADDHFDISTFRLEADGLQFGLGRERFAALVEPAFMTVDEFESWLVATRRHTPAMTTLTPAEEARRASAAQDRRDRVRVILVDLQGEARIYPIPILRDHELVNDRVGDTPIFVAYCYLADLGAAYHRRYGEATLTFAVSGYTYADETIWDGLDAFVLWDRDTESLWWPPIGRAVSGPLVDHALRLVEDGAWQQTTWAAAKATHPHALVLAPDQRFTPPTAWPSLNVATVVPAQRGADVPPRWGQ